MKYLLKIVFVLLVINTSAQQVVMFSHYFRQPMLYNPSAAGSMGGTNIMLINHTQWTGFAGAPQYNILTIDGNLFNKSTGVGLSLISDKKGINNRLGGNLFYSYKLKFNQSTHLLLGLSAGVINQSLNLSSATIENQNDPYLFLNSQQTTSFDANAGLTFVLKNFELGFAVPQLAGNKLGYTSTTDIRTYYTQVRHYMSTLKYKVSLSKTKNINLTPLLLVRYVPNTPFQYDGNLTMDYKNIFWLGTAYKSNYAVGVNAGVNLFKQLSIGYNYDVMIGSVSKYAGLSHEIMLSFRFNGANRRQKDSLSRKEKEQLEAMAHMDLNQLIIQNITKKIDALLDKGNPTQEEINQLLEEISAFFDTDPNDIAMQDVVRKYHNSLKNINSEKSVLVKGKVIYDDKPTANDYRDIIINVIDLSTNTIVATCHPTSKEGKYFIILKPGRKYTITAESPSYPKSVRNFSPDGSIESYEMSQEIHLKK